MTDYTMAQLETQLREARSEIETLRAQIAGALDAVNREYEGDGTYGEEWEQHLIGKLDDVRQRLTEHG